MNKHLRAALIALTLAVGQACMPAWALTNEETDALVNAAKKREAVDELHTMLFQRIHLRDMQPDMQCKTFFERRPAFSGVLPDAECQAIAVSYNARHTAEAAEAAQKAREEIALKELTKQKAEKEAEQNRPMTPDEKAARVAGLRGGTIRPETLFDWRAIMGADDGSKLATSPKLKPDGKAYWISGIVESVDANGGFVVAFNYSGFPLEVQRTQNPALTGYDYVHVAAKKNAEGDGLGVIVVGRGVDIVGRYTDNQRYRTTGGQVKTMASISPGYIARWTSSYLGVGLQ